MGITDNTIRTSVGGATFEAARPADVADAPWVYRPRSWESSQSGMSQPSAADRAEQPLRPDTQVTTAILGSP